MQLELEALAHRGAAAHCAELQPSCNALLLHGSITTEEVKQHEDAREEALDRKQHEDAGDASAKETTRYIAV
jgi:hypothetical protein